MKISPIDEAVCLAEEPSSSASTSQEASVDEVPAVNAGDQEVTNTKAARRDRNMDYLLKAFSAHLERKNAGL